MKPNPKTGTIIVVAEDDADDRLLIEDALKEAHLHAQVVFVEDGDALLALLRRQGKYAGLAGDTRPELILLDLNMPRKDGWQVLEEMRSDEHLDPIPVVVLTTSSDPKDVRRSYTLGGNGFITKPNSFSDLVKAMQALDRYWFETVQLPCD